MRLPSALAFLVDEATAMPSADVFLATLGGKLVADGIPILGGALTQVNQMSARLTSLADQVAAQGKPAPDNRGTAEVESQVKALSQRTDKIASDIRQLYRLLEGGR